MRDAPTAAAPGEPAGLPFDERADSDPGQADGPDMGLLEQVMAGSQAAFARLYDRHVATVYRASTRVNGDPSVAAEVVQETFLTLWNRAELFDPSRGSLRAWLATIARNRAVDHHRRAVRQRATAFASFGRPETDDTTTVEWLARTGTMIGAAGPERMPDEVLTDGETSAAIAMALASIGPSERQVIELAYRAGLSQSEIAAHLGWPLGTVKTRTRRALRRLREHLEVTTSDPPVPAAEGADAGAGKRRRTRSARGRVLRIDRAGPLSGRSSP